MTDLDTLLPDRLRHLADEQAPARDPLAQAAAARSRYRRQRRTRVAVVGTVVAVAAIVVGVPLAFHSLAAAPGHGVAGTVETTAPSDPPTTASSTPTTDTSAASASSAAASASSAAASAADAAELAQAVGLMEPLAFDRAPGETQCDRLDPGQLSHLMGLGTGVAPAEGDTVASISGCRFASVATPGGTGGLGVELGIGYLAATSVADTLPMTDPDGRCATAALPSSPAGAVLQRCTTDGTVQWWVHAPVANQAVYVLGVTVDGRWTGIPGPEVVARFAGFLSRNW